MARDINWGEDVTSLTFDEPPIDVDTVDKGSPFEEVPTPNDNGDSEPTPLFGDGDGPSSTEKKGPRRKKEERPTRTFGPRKALGDGIAAVWGGAGALLAQTGLDPAVGRAMVVQAPLAGEQVDQLISGTFVDKLVQPFAAKGESGKQAMAVLALPLVIGLLERNPTNPLIGQAAYQIVKQNMHALVPVLKEQARKAQEEAEVLEELTDFFEFPPEVKDPVQFVLMSILGAPAPQREENVESEASMDTEGVPYS